MTEHATSEKGAQGVVEKLRASATRLQEVIAERRHGGSAAMRPEDRAELERFVAELWHEDCEFFPLIGGVEGKTSYRGRDGVLAFYEDFWGTFDVTYEEPEFRVIGNAIVQLTAMDLRGRESGVHLTSELGVVYVLDGDLIRTGRAYDSQAAALAAAEELDAQA